jgi:Tat protein secretion system quality control protein TatD with DNase activity
VLAEARGIPPERAHEITTMNFHRLFSKVPAA